jgi:uncharacterized protein (DUF433 family)
MLQAPTQKVPLEPDREGVLYIAGTGVSLHSVVGMFEEGASPEEIANEYTSLRLQDVYTVIAYYLNNKEALDSRLAEEESASEKRCAEYEVRLPHQLRQKLLRPRGAAGGG